MTTNNRTLARRSTLGRSTKKAAPEAQCCEATNAGLIEIQIEYRNVTDLVLDPRNPRQHSQSQVNQIADSIREFGFVMPSRSSQCACRASLLSAIRSAFSCAFDRCLISSGAVGIKLSLRLEPLENGNIRGGGRRLSAI